jgi:hypothetical protein
MNLIEFIQYEATNHPDVNPVPAKKLIPEWYKKLDSYTGDKDEIFTAPYLLNNLINSKGENPIWTIKSCAPVQDYMCSGYVIRATADLLLTQDNLVNNQTSWSWFSADNKTMSCDFHVFKQCPISINGKNNTYIKIVHNLGVKTPKGYSCLFYQPEFFFETRFKLFPAIVDTDSFNNPVNFPGIITSKKENVTISAGTPLMVVMPFKREDWTHKISIAEQPRSRKISVDQWYKKFFRSNKSYD